MMNTFGHIFRLTTFGESHGAALGGVIDGAPAGLRLDLDAIAAEMRRRRPGDSPLTSRRKEADEVEWLSGIFQGLTTGTPIGFIIRNRDARSSDYDAMAAGYRPCHADYTYVAKYGVRDHRGGGRASARETAARVAAGAVARQFLNIEGISVRAELIRVGSSTEPTGMAAEIEAARAQGDSVGGIVQCVASGVPAGLGEPVFGKLQSSLAAAMMSIPGAKGFEYGDGFELATRLGSQVLDIFENQEGKIITQSNHSGGIQGGISNGMPIVMRIAFKPTPTILHDLPTIDNQGNSIILKAKGRHDPCIAVRAVPVVEAMACLTLLDALLMLRASHHNH